jgi:release factor glutamine methyltransferase
MKTRTPAPTAGALLREGLGRLQAASLQTARQDAEWLLAAVLGLARFDLYLEPARPVTAGQCRRYRALLQRRADHEPLQHLLGFEEFRGLRLGVTPDVLVPRPETEGLVEWAEALLAPLARPVVADVGTGSGAIACALAMARPDAEVLAIDASLPALAVATANVRRLGLSGQVRLVAGDLLGPLASVAGSVDMIVANLPYLPSALIQDLPREVAAFEPRLALDGGADGLGVVRRLVAAAPATLRPGGALLMEIGEEQAREVLGLMSGAGFEGIETRLDLRGVERYMAGRIPG